MLHFETNLVQPTVNFCVPDLNRIANQDEDIHAMEAIVQMNALVLGVYTHFPEGLSDFRRLSEADESTLESDMFKVGGGKQPSVSKRFYSTEYTLCYPFVCSHNYIYAGMNVTMIFGGITTNMLPSWKAMLKSSRFNWKRPTMT